MPAVATVLGDKRISEFFEHIHATSERDIVEQSKMLVRSYLGKPIEKPLGGLETLAVRWHHRYPLASHLAVQLVTGEREIGYTTAPVDWVPA